jgi:hypothetical protein
MLLLNGQHFYFEQQYTFCELNVPFNSKHKIDEGTVDLMGM